MILPLSSFDLDFGNYKDRGRFKSHRFPYPRIPREGQLHAGRVPRRRDLFLPLQPQLPSPVVFVLTYLVIIADSPEAFLLSLEDEDLTA